MIPLPRLYSPSLVFEKSIRPISVSLNLSITPLSYASIELPVDENVPARSYVELFSPLGSAGFFRVRSPQNAYGNDVAVAELEHAIVEVGDYVVRAEYDEMMSAGTAMQTIFSHYRGSKWQLGSVSAMGTDQIAVEVNHVRVLEAMMSLMDQCPDCMLSFDFSTTPWTVSVVAKSNQVTAEGRLSRNVSSAKITYDDTELCTRVYYQIPTTDSSGDPANEWTSMDADTISTYGVVERDFSAGSDYTVAECNRAASEYLKQHKHPRVSVEIGAEELSRITGEALDTFTIGKMFRLALPDYNTTIEQNITGISWNDVYGVPENMIVTLADEEDTAVRFLHDLDAKGGSGGGGGGSRKQKKEWQEYYTDIQRDSRHIELMAVRVDTSERILQQAGIYLDSEGVIVYSDDDENMWASHLKVQSQRIDLVVEGTGTNAHIKPAAIVASINNGASNIKISASHVDIDGILSVAVTEMTSLTPSTGELSITGDVAVGGDLGAGGLTADDGYITLGDATLTLAPHSASWQEQTVVYSVTQSRTNVYTWLQGSADNITTWRGQLVTSVTGSTTTINYLGR